METYSLWFAGLSALATLAAAVAAVFSAMAAYRAPVNAAKLASKLQSDNLNRQIKLNVFATLMQNRASIADLEAVKMLNIIDVVFADSKPVRIAWVELYNAFNDRRLF